MKSVIAFIKSHKLSDVLVALNLLDNNSEPSVSNVNGFVRGCTENRADGTISEQLDHLYWFRVELVCSEELVDEFVSVIDKNAATGGRDDGFIYVSEIERAVRINSFALGGHAQIEFRSAALLPQSETTR